MNFEKEGPSLSGEELLSIHIIIIFYIYYHFHNSRAQYNKEDGPLLDEMRTAVGLLSIVDIKYQGVST